MAIIGISGKAGTGKDTVGNYVLCFLNSKNNKFEIKKYAQKLKDSIEFKFPTLFNTFDWENSDRKYRNEYLYSLQRTRRQLLIDEGMALRGVHQNYWVTALIEEYDDKQHNWIITDMRFKNEFMAVKNKGGICIRVERSGYADSSNHISEVDLDDVSSFDYVIQNNGDMDDLLKKVYAIAEEIKIKLNLK